jgi:hypothetical protein
MRSTFLNPDFCGSGTTARRTPCPETRNTPPATPYSRLSTQFRGPILHLHRAITSSQFRHHLYGSIFQTDIACVHQVAQSRTPSPIANSDPSDILRKTYRYLDNLPAVTLLYAFPHNSLSSTYTGHERGIKMHSHIDSRY